MTATVRAIARAAGVSHTTVSRVLNRSSAVRKSTRARVLAEVARLDYTPHHAARALATRRTRTIGAVVPSIDSSSNAAWLNALESTLERHGFALIIATAGFDRDVEARRGLDLIGLGAEALVVLGLEHDERLLRAARSRGVPIACTGVFEPEFALPTIGADSRAMGAVAMHHLLDRGHERIALVSGPLSGNDRARMRLAGALEAHPDRSKLPHLETSLSVEGGVRAIRELATMMPRPTAMLCVSDIPAMGALFELPRQGLKVPDDLSVVGLDDFDWAPHIEPALTAVHTSQDEVGRALGEAVVRHLDEGEPIDHIEVKTHLQERSSTARRRGWGGSARVGVKS